MTTLVRLPIGIAVLSACACLAQNPSAPAQAGATPPAAAPPPATAPLGLSTHAEHAGEVLHLVAGRSMFIDTASRLRRVYVGNPAVLDSVTTSPTRIFITAKAPGSSSLLLTDEAGQSQVYLVSSDIDVEGLRRNLHNEFPGDEVKVTSLEDRVSLSGTASSDAAADAAVKLASLYSKTVASTITINPSHIKQVKLEVRILEIDRSKLDQFGLNFASGGKNSSAITTGTFPSTISSTTAPGSSTVSVSDPLNLFFYHFPFNVGVTIKDLENRQIAQILAEPNITTLSGQKASFLSGGEFPYPIVQPGGVGNNAVITISFRPYGVKLEFTPTVNPDGTIQLKVSPEVSALDYSNAVIVSGFTIPALSTRRAETQVELRDGQSFAISGLLDHRTTELLSKIPGIGDVPLLGQIFRAKNFNLSTVELMVIVTPTIVDPLTDTREPVPPVFPTAFLDSESFDKSYPSPAGAAAANTAEPK